MIYIWYIYIYSSSKPHQVPWTPLQARTEGEARGEVAEAAEAERGLAMDPRRNYNSRELNVDLSWD